MNRLRLMSRTTRSFFGKFQRMCNVAGLKPSNSPFLGKTQQQWTELFLQDEQLNNLPLRFFDAYFNYYQMAYFRDKYSLSDNACMLKHHIIFNIIGAKADFEDELEVA